MEQFPKPHHTSAETQPKSEALLKVKEIIQKIDAAETRGFLSSPEATPEEYHELEVAILEFAHENTDFQHMLNSQFEALTKNGPHDSDEKEPTRRMFKEAFEEFTKEHSHH